jgi:hypothetical protein
MVTRSSWRALASGLRSRVARFVFALLTVATIGGARPAWSHPIHTTLTEISLGPGDRTMQFTIRAFADDFSAAVAKHAKKPRPADYTVPDADIISYVASAISVEASGKTVPFTWAASRRAGDVIWVTFTVPSVHALRGVRMASTLLFELYDDQVNIVQTSVDGRHRSMLFTAGDGKKLKAVD